MVIKTNLIIPKSQRAATVGPFILMRPGSENDLPLYYHELEHAKQWWLATFAGFILLAAFLFAADQNGYVVDSMWAATACACSTFIHGILYLVSSRYRLWAEVQGHRAEHYRDNRRLMRLAGNLCTNYRINISYEQALALIRG